MRLISAILLSALACTAAGLPAPYHKVSRIVFVVPSAATAAAAWSKTGVPVSAVHQLDGKYAARGAVVSFENVVADLIEPATRGPLHDFLQRHHGGGFALVHRFPNEAELSAEAARLKQLGVAPLLDVNWAGVHYLFLDTAREGKYSLALATYPDAAETRSARRVTQFAFVANDIEAVSAYWAKLGFPEMTYSHPDTSELVYRGKPGTYDMRLGWQRHTPVPFEWIQPLRGPSTYYDHMKRHSEGFHHLAFNAPDMDAAIAEWSQFGFPMVMDGAWGDKGKPGSGRFAYHDLDSCCGHEIELLWNYKGQ